MTRQAENKKTVRHFQCRDYLWDVFEQMSAELECSTDYLINEAMRQYARSRNYGTNRSDQHQQVEPSAPPPPRSSAAAPSGAIPSLRATVERPPLPSPPAYPAKKPEPRVTSRATAPLPQVNAPLRTPSVPPPPPPPGRPAQLGVSRPRVSSPPPLPGAGRGMTPVAHRASRPPLFVIFNNQRIPITKDEFVIGRSAKAADLPIKDGNISRRHAAVVFQEGAFYIKDLGSTNGIEFQGRNVDSKQIDEGDVYRLCDYELRFTYH